MFRQAMINPYPSRVGAGWVQITSFGINKWMVLKLKITYELVRAGVS